MLFGKDYQAADEAAQRWLQLRPRSVRAHRLAAIIKLRAGDGEQAQAHLLQVLRNLDNLRQGFMIVTALLAGAENKRLAAQVMRNLSGHYPDSVHAGLALARLLHTVEQYRESLEAADTVLARHPDNVDALVIAARSRLEVGRADEALAMFKRAVSLYPDKADLRLNYARVLGTARRYRQAIEQYDRLIATTGAAANRDAHVFSAALLSFQIHDYAQAEWYLRRLLERANYRQEARYYLGLSHENRMQYERALDWFRQVDKDSLFVDAQIGAARVEGKTGQTDAALRRFQRLHAARPGDKPALWMGESEMWREAGDDKAAFAVLDRAVRAMPDDVDLRYSRALAADRVGRIELLERDLREILRREPDHAHAMNALGYTLADKTTRLDEALSLIRRALELEPDDSAIIDSMGWVQYRLGNLDEAVRFLRKANETHKDGEIGAHLGEVLWVKGEREAAVEVWREALREDPDNEVLRRVIERFNPW